MKLGNLNKEDLYETGAKIVGGVVFLCSYSYCIANYGFLFGLGLGWIPSMIVAALVMILLPMAPALFYLFLTLLLAGVLVAMFGLRFGLF